MSPEITTSQGTHSPLGTLAQVLGITASLGCISMWIVNVFFNPYSQSGRTAGSYVVAGVMILAAAVGLYGAKARKPGLLLLAFAVSFIPVGFYMMLTPGIFQAIGYFDLLLLLAAVALQVFSRREARFPGKV